MAGQPGATGGLLRRSLEAWPGRRGIAADRSWHLHPPCETTSGRSSGEATAGCSFIPSARQRLSPGPTDLIAPRVVPGPVRDIPGGSVGRPRRPVELGKPETREKCRMANCGTRERPRRSKGVAVPRDRGYDEARQVRTYSVTLRLERRTYILLRNCGQNPGEVDQISCQFPCISAHEHPTTGHVMAVCTA